MCTSPLESNSCLCYISSHIDMLLSYVNKFCVKKHQYEEVNFLWLSMNVKRCVFFFLTLCTNIKDFTSCLCDLWMMVCLYLLSKEIIIYHILPWATNIFFWIFSISLKGKRDNYKGRTLKWKRRHQEQQHLLRR
jgi:hypothetical protein